MLNTDQLLQLFIRQGVPLVGRQVVEAIRAGDPIRRVGGGTRNVATRFASGKMACVIQAESHKGELPAVYGWEHDPKTLEFYDQPSQVKLSYRSATGKWLTHLSTPDYFVIQDDWMGWVECKPEAMLREEVAEGSERFVSDGAGGWRCPSGEAFAGQFGLGFLVRSDKETNWILVRNLEFLSDYLAPGCPESSEEDRATVMRAFDTERWLLLSELLQAQDVSADTVFAMVAKGELFIDLETELLAEPIFTNVCRDELSSSVYRSQRRIRYDVPSVPLQQIALRPGTRIVWDGQPWRILNVGNAQVVLEDSQRAISTLSGNAFQQLFSSGAILGELAEGESVQSIAEDILRKAAPADLDHAVKWSSRLEAVASGADDVPARTLRYWRKRARESEVAYGNGFVGLVARISARGNRRRKICPGAIDAMNEIIDAEVMTANQPKLSMCYGMVRNRCKERGLIPPSDKTFRAEIRRRREEHVTLARQGRKAAYAGSEFQWHIDQSTPRHGERPFEVGHIDHTELDVEAVDSRTGANLRRPWLTILVDAFTRVILAFFLSFDPPSYRSCMAVIRQCVRRHSRIPKTVVVDQGSDFESLYFEALLARLGTHKKSRPASKGRFGSVIERLFGVTNQAFVHNLAGNSQALQRPRSMSPTHDPRTLAVWTLPALNDAFEEFAYSVYGKRTHPAIGLCPNDALERGLAMTGLRGHTLIPYDEAFVRLTMPTTPAGKATVRPGRGIKIKGIHYWHPIFREPKVERTAVPILFDPFDVSRAYALVQGEWVLCRSEHQALFERRSEREIFTLSQEIRQLHYLAGVRRGVNAEDLALFMAKVRDAESVLRQQRRDAERLAAENAEPPVAQAPLCLPDRSMANFDPWAGPVSLEIYKDLK